MINHILYADEAGESHWRNEAITLTEKTFAPPASDIHVSETQAVSALTFLTLRAGWNEPIHSSPAAQVLLCLSGAVRVTASDGDIREIGPGGIWTMTDTAGKGHHTEVISDVDFTAAIVQIA